MRAGRGPVLLTVLRAVGRRVLCCDATTIPIGERSERREVLIRIDPTHVCGKSCVAHASEILLPNDKHFDQVQAHIKSSTDGDDEEAPYYASCVHLLVRLIGESRDAIDQL